MGRWRPPVGKSSPYITPAGEARLRAELHQLWKIERPQVTAAVHEAAKNGDRSENGDYIYGKKRLREIDRRVRYLQKRLEELTVVTEPPSDPSRIYFNARVTLEDEDGTEITYRIVGPDEFDLSQGLLSMDAPLARALMGKRADDEVSIEAPGGTRSWYVVAVDYPINQA
ncbi:MAG: transcription elongation factor GreB [Gammaproteobacteria bacterium]|nr:MAG: transcription elongation factor GreB [Gammaproteobacteria bacterium]